MNELLHERYESLKKRQKYFMVDYKELEDSINSGEQKKETEYCTESKYDMEYPAEVWCEQFTTVGYDLIIYIYGIGNYLYLKKFVDKVKFAVAVVYEPNARYFTEFLCEDVESVLTAENVYFITGKERYQLLKKTLDNFLTYNNRKKLVLANIPNYVKRYENDYEEYCNIIKTKCDNIVFDKSTQILHEQIQSYNYLNNIFKLIDEAGIQELSDVVQEFVNYPAVIVSAGPSLDKNVKILNEYKGMVFIVAVDAALNTLKENNVIPDLVVTMDPKFEKINAMCDKRYNNLPMIVNVISGYKLLKSHTGRKFFDLQQNNFIGTIADEYNKILPILGTGGSVANSAFSFLEFAGFKNIILIGQDLAYPNNRLHANGAFENERDIEAESGKYYYVRDIYGNKVLTEKNMDLYRLWFENAIAGNSSLNVIDATEGGALIKGTTIMTLNEAMDIYAFDKKQNFTNIINKARYLFDDNMKSCVKEEIIKYYDTIDNAVLRLSNGKKLYSKLEDLYYKRKSHTRQFQNIMGKIKELTNYIDLDPQMALFDMYATEEKTNIIDNMIDDNDATQQIHMLVESGKKMLDAYILAGEKIKEDWNRYQEYFD